MQLQINMYITLHKTFSS